MKILSENLGKSKATKKGYDNQRQAALWMAYLGGIIDGEGTIRVNKCTGIKSMKAWRAKNPKYSPVISVGMTDNRPIELLKAKLGGSMRLERASDGNKPIYRWAITGREDAKKALEQLLPYLIVKKQQAILLLDFIDGMPDKNEWRKGKKGLSQQELLRREEAYWKMRKLNAVGAAATTERKNIREDETTV